MNTRQFAKKYGVKLRSRAPLSPLGDTIDAYCIAHKMSRQAFADRAGIARQTLSGVIRNNKKWIDVRVMTGIKKALEIK